MQYLALRIRSMRFGGLKLWVQNREFLIRGFMDNGRVLLGITRQ